LALYLLILFLFLLLAVFFSASETAFMVVNRVRLKYRAETGDKRAEVIKHILGNPDRLLGVILLGSTISNIGAASLVTYLVGAYAPQNQKETVSLLASATLTFVILIFCELTPKIIAATNSELSSRRLLPAIRFSILVLSPLSRSALWLANRAVRLFRASSTASPFASALSEDEIKAIIEGSSPAVMAEDRKEMLHNVFKIGALRVREIMIPRGEVTAVDIGDPLPEILATVTRTNYSRIPVFRENFDNLVGILNVKDLLSFISRPGDINLQLLLRPVHFVPDTAPLELVLRQLQSMHLHMAIVVDEFGGVEGIVTLEDVLEEIVGEIRDEHDTEMDLVHELGPNLFSIAGNLPVKDFNRIFDARIPEAREYTTMAGFLEARTGRLLQEGEIIRYQNLVFSIEKADGFKIVSIRVRNSTVFPAAAKVNGTTSHPQKT
jgi:putative hemolysin